MKVLGIGSKIKMYVVDPEIKTVVSIDSEHRDGKVEATGVTLNDGSTVSRCEIEAALDALKR